jgi:hypothetical protein
MQVARPRVKNQTTGCHERRAEIRKPHKAVFIGADRLLPMYLPR